MISLGQAALWGGLFFLLGIFMFLVAFAPLIDMWFRRRR